MQYARLGNTGLIVSRLAFGAMTFGAGTAAANAFYKVSQNAADLLVGRSLDAGINHFNTADIYADGHSEIMLGKALGDRRHDVVISTKVGNRMGKALNKSGLSRKNIIAAVDASLKRLDTDYIDIYLAHRVDPYTPVEETVEAFQHLVAQGKVRYVGFSNWPAWMAAKAVGYQKANGYEPFRAAEMYYSLVGRDLEHELAPFVADAGIGVLVWSPLAGGFLSGKYTREDPKGGGGRLSSINLVPLDLEKGYGVVDVLKKIAAARSTTPAAIALAWLQSRPWVASVLIGATGVEQLDQNLAAADLVLSAEDVSALDKASAVAPPYPNWFMERFADRDAPKALGA
jgi:aryl-alcohol dehydrogenase-like predicted oxidoreductase